MRREAIVWRAPTRRFCAGSPPPARSAGRAPPSAPSPRPGPGAPRSSPPAPARGGHGAGAAPPLAGVGGAVARPEGSVGPRSARLRSAREGSAEAPGNGASAEREAPGAAGNLRFGDAWEGTPACPAAPAPLPGARRASSCPSRRSVSIATSALLSSPPSLPPPFLRFPPPLPHRVFLSPLSISLCFHPLTPSLVYVFLFLYVFPFSVFFSSSLCISNLLSSVLFFPSPFAVFTALCPPPASPSPPLPPVPGA